jgi:hypothetical protein
MIKNLRSQRGSWTLIGLLVATAIVLVVAGMVYVRTTSSHDAAIEQQLGAVPGSQKTTIPGKALDAANNAVCEQNLSQIRQAVTAYQSTNTEGGFPSSLEAAGITDPALLKCTVGGEPYNYNPSTGVVRCSHPGHQAF